ncbi:MAG: zinc-ribbon domain-containing protein [Oscillospiraceae bacterium]|nr:zinc-ribbon domain-containing protein [Oscillospiraceae bacterium]
MSHYCTQCGAKVANDDALFCHKCGAALAHAFLDKPDNTEEADSPAFAEPVAEGVDDVEEVAECVSERELFETEPIEEDVIATKPQKRIRPASVLSVAAQVLLSIVFFAVVTAGQSWFVLQKGINNHTVKTAARAVVDEVDFSEITVPGFVNDNDVSIPGVSARTALPEAIYNTIDDYYREVFGVEKDHIRELLESDMFRSFFGKIIDDGVDYIMGADDANVIVSSDKIVELIEENKDEIEGITSYSLVESDFDDIKKVLKNSGIDNLTWDSATGSTHDAYLIRRAFSLLERHSLLSIIVISVAAVLLIAVFAVLNRRRISNTLLYFGIPCIFSGGAFVAGWLIGADLLFRWATRELGIGTQQINAVRDAFSGTGEVIMYSGFAVLGIGGAAITVKALTSFSRFSR